MLGEIGFLFTEVFGACLQLGSLELFWSYSGTLSGYCPLVHLHLNIAQVSSLHPLPRNLMQEKKSLQLHLLVSVGDWVS